MRNRKTASCSGGRQHTWGGNADVSRSLGTYRQEDAEETSGQGQPARPAEHTPTIADSSRSSVRALRKDVRALGEVWNPRASVLHRGLQQYLDLETGLRLHLRLSAG